MKLSHLPVCLKPMDTLKHSGMYEDLDGGGPSKTSQRFHPPGSSVTCEIRNNRRNNLQRRHGDPGRPGEARGHGAGSGGKADLGHVSSPSHEGRDACQMLGLRERG